MIFRNSMLLDIAEIAQLEEQLICNQQVVGSSPTFGFCLGLTLGHICLRVLPRQPSKKGKHAGINKVFGCRGRRCGFESRSCTAGFRANVHQPQ